MKPQKNITIYRTNGDTDPIYLKLQVSNNNVVSVISNTATASMVLEGNTSINGSNLGNGIFSFPMTSINASSTYLSFSVNVSDDYNYKIAEGTIKFD